MSCVWKLGCAALISALALSACDSDDDTNDAGTLRDAGLADGGARLDASVGDGGADGGADGGRDGGTTIGDGGTTIADAGARDGGTTTADAGARDGGTTTGGDGGTTTGRDAGTTLADGGTTMGGDAGTTTGGDGGTSTGASFSGSVHPLLMMRCAPCHSPTGVASFTRFVLVDDVPADLTTTLMFVTPANPAASPLLTKGSGQVTHGGGAVLPAGSPGFLLLESWVTGGTAP